MFENKKAIYPLILLVVCLLFAFSTTTWINMDDGVTFVSDAAHLFNASSHFKNIKAFDIADFMLTREMYPNLFHQLTSFLSFFTGDVLQAFVYLNLVFIILLSFGAYFTGEYLWNGETGLTAGILTLSLPGIVGYSRINNIDIACAAAVIWTLYFLIRCNRFKNRGWSLGFFALCGVGMLIKWAFVFFLIAPFISALIPQKEESDEWNWKGFAIFWIVLVISYSILLLVVNFLEKDELGFPPIDKFWVFYLVISILGVFLFFIVLYIFKSKESRICNLISGFVLFLLLTNHYYLFSFQYLVKTYTGRFWGHELKKHASEHNFYTFFIKFFTLEIIGIIVVVFAVVGIIYYLFRGKKKEEINLLLWSLGAGLVFLALQPLYINRYFLPLAGTIVLFSAFWIFNIPDRRIRWLITVPLAIISFLSWSGWFLLPSSVNKIFPEIVIERPLKKNWDLRKIVKFAWKDFQKEREKRNSGLFIFNDMEKLSNMKPLVIMFYFSKEMSADEKIFFYPEDINLRKSNPGIPLIYYIMPDADEDMFDNNLGKTDEPNDKGPEIKRKGGNDIEWRNINPEYICYIDFVRAGVLENKNGLSADKIVGGNFQPLWEERFRKKTLLREFEVPGFEDKILIYRSISN